MFCRTYSPHCSERFLVIKAPSLHPFVSFMTISFLLLYADSSFAGADFQCNRHAAHNNQIGRKNV